MTDNEIKALGDASAVMDGYNLFMRSPILATIYNGFYSENHDQVSYEDFSAATDAVVQWFAFEGIEVVHSYDGNRLRDIATGKTTPTFGPISLTYLSVYMIRPDLFE